MTGAMYAAIGGLKSHMSKLNVIGHNTSNVNTYGYKAQRMTFMESMYTTSRSGSNGGATTGGNNPSQIGYGCSIGSIDLNMSPSTYAPTGCGLDTYIDGEGFFLVGDKDVNITGADGVEKLDLSRVGDFWIDPDGYVCNRQGAVLYGFATVQNPFYVPGGGADADLEKEAAAAGFNTTSKTVISSQLVPLRVPLSAAAPTEKNGGLVPGDANASPPTDDSYNWEEGSPVYPYLSSYVEQNKTYYVNNYVSHDDDAKATAPWIDTTGNGGTPSTGTELGYGKTMAVAAKNTDPKSTSGDLICQLSSVGVQKNGAIQGIAEDGSTVVIGYIAIASVDSPDGVTHIDGPYYKALGGAGTVRVSALGGVLEDRYLGNQVIDNTDPDNPVVPDARDRILEDSTTETRDGGLEASSTDVAEEYTQLITTQRGFQANTRIVTVTDSMLEELVNMKR